MVRAMKDVVKQAIEIDKAFTRLQMITLASREEIDKMKQSYISLAKEMKVSLSTVTDAAETWLRTGMDAAEATTALQASTVLSKDAFMEGADAASVLIAAQKAYKLETNDLIGVVDKLTTLDTKAATTAQDLGEALALSGASASAAGFSMDKYLALLATSSEVTQQSASVIGNAWKTLTARLRKVGAGASLDDEGEDISDVDKVLKQYGINLREVSNGMTNMENVVTALGEKWKFLNGEQKAQIATAVAGTRQQNIFIATMENYDRVLELTKESMYSAGSAMDKFNVYSESTEAKIQELKTAWTELADATLNSDLVEWFINIGKQALEATTKMGGLIPVVVALGGALLALKTGGGVGLAIGATVGVGVATYTGLQLAASKRIEQAGIESKKTQELIDKNDELSKNINEQIATYIHLQSISEKTEAQNKELVDTQKELAKMYGVSTSALSNYTDVLEHYSEVQKTAKEEEVKALEEEIKKYEGYLNDAQAKTGSAIVGGAGFDVLSNVLYSLIQGAVNKAAQKEVDAYSSKLEELKEKLKDLKVEIGDISVLSGTIFEGILSGGAWEKSEAGAKKMSNTISFLVQEVEKLGSPALKTAVTAILNEIKQDVELFMGTDFVLTEYYDKRLQALKEQKELEDELAKQKENEEKIANAELKVQEAALDVEKKRAELAKAKEKRIQVFRMGKGLVYEEDTESIANAQESLNKSLDNYTNAQKDLAKTIADIEGTLTEQLISAVEKLEKIYAMGLIDEQGGQKLRDYFLTKGNREAYESWSKEQQLDFLMQFLSPENQAKAMALWGLNETDVEQSGGRTRSSVFGYGGTGEQAAKDYLSTYQSVQTETDTQTGNGRGGGILPYRATSAEISEARRALENNDYAEFKKFLPSSWNEEGKENYFKKMGGTISAPIATVQEINSSGSDFSREITAWIDYLKERPRNANIWLKDYDSFWGAVENISPNETTKALNSLDASKRDSVYKQIRQSVLGYHTGGIVGQPAFSSDNEMYAKLLKGEIVLPQTKFNDIINKVQGVTNNDSTVISIGNISLPSVTDTDSFVNELKRISYSS